MECHPAGKDDDDEMTFADATHRMCYKITDIPFTEVTVTAQTLYVYADDFPVRDGTVMHGYASHIIKTEMLRISWES